MTARPTSGRAGRPIPSASPTSPTAADRRRSGSWIPTAATPRQVTNLSTEADGVLFSPDGKNLVFTSDVYPECGADDACNKKNLDAEKANKVKARIYTELLYRHWTAWQAQAAQPSAGGRRCRAGAPRDLTPGTRDVPPFSLGGPDDYDISPDGQEVCYSMNADPVPAISTNSDLYAVSIAGGPAAQDHHHPGRGFQPAAIRPTANTSPGARSSAPGYESDRWRLMVLERATGNVTNLTENLDRWVNSFTWSPDSTRAVLHHRRPRPPGHPVDSGRGRRRAHGGQRRQRAGRHAVDRATARPWSTPSRPASPRSEIYRASSSGRRAGGAHAFERRSPGRLSAHAARGVLGGWRRTARRCRVSW